MGLFTCRNVKNMLFTVLFTVLFTEFLIYLVRVQAYNVNQPIINFKNSSVSESEIFTHTPRNKRFYFAAWENNKIVFAVRQWKEGISKFLLAPAVVIMSTAVGN